MTTMKKTAMIVIALTMHKMFTLSWGVAGFVHQQPSMIAVQKHAVPMTATKTVTGVSRGGTKLDAVPAVAAAVAPEIWTSFLPTCLGYLRSEFGVSYGYGLATALGAVSIMKRFPDSLFPWHSKGLVFYGVRLCAFLFIRTQLSARIKKTVKDIEERAQKRGNRWARTPFVVSCSFLYYGLVLPVKLTSRLTADMITPTIDLVFRSLIILQWFGFGIAALGDLTKTYVKQSEKNEKYLVTSGIYSIMRHPNYSGEIIGWTASHLSAILAGILLLKNSFSLSVLGDLSISVLGWVGIVYVLLRATSGLETRQKNEYGNDTKYKEWVTTSWAGWQFSPNKEASETEEPAIEVSDTEEEYGSGI